MRCRRLRTDFGILVRRLRQRQEGPARGLDATALSRVIGPPAGGIGSRHQPLPDASGHRGSNEHTGILEAVSDLVGSGFRQTPTVSQLYTPLVSELRRDGACTVLRIAERGAHWTAFQRRIHRT